jgi:hypothetical protein
MCKCSSCGKCARHLVIKNFAEGGLKRWFKEKWTNQKGDPCGAGTTKNEPKCRPSKRVSSKTPKTWGEMTDSQKKKAIKEKNKATKKGRQFSDYELSRKGSK